MTLENMQQDSPYNITNAIFHLASSVYVEVECTTTTLFTYNDYTYTITSRGYTYFSTIA